jgi:hypothetical protein
MLLRTRILLFSLPAALAVSAEAQVVGGSVVGIPGREPIESAIVMLVDSTGRAVGGAFTNAQGRFELSAPRAGTYVLRAERVGYGTAESAPFRMGGQKAEVVVELSRVVLELESVRVSGVRSNCIVRPGQEELLGRMWEEVRKILAATVMTARAPGRRFGVLTYELDRAQSAEILSERGSQDVRTTVRPFGSVDPARLERDGFLWGTPEEGMIFIAPDAETLLSEPFIATHCFYLVGGPPDSSAVVGLAFEPVRGRRTRGIAGTLWIDRVSGELRSIDVRYTNLPGNVSPLEAGAHIEFTKLPDQRWIVRRWVLRMPQYLLIETPATRRTPATREFRLDGVREAGGEVLWTEWSDSNELTLAPPARLLVQVIDSTRGEPLPGARVSAGPSLEQLTDAEGRVSFDALPAGWYDVAVYHPRLDSLGDYPRRSVALPGGSNRTILLHTQNFDSLLAKACPERRTASPLPALIGRILHGETAEPVADAEVVLTWSEDARGRQPDRRSSSVRADSLGVFRFCTPPYGFVLHLEARLREFVVLDRVRPLARRELLNVELRMELPDER